MVPESITIHDDLPGVTDDLFWRLSHCHGEGHVNRVIVLGDVLLQKLGLYERWSRPLWAATFIHDLARTHDGDCEAHGRRSVEERMPEFIRMFMEHGVRYDDLPAIRSAVTFHSLTEEAHRDHPDYTLISLLKDADCLDRWRINDLDPSYLRWSTNHNLVDFSKELCEGTFLGDVSRIEDVREVAKSILHRVPA